jgi:hypothetical protein
MSESLPRWNIDLKVVVISPSVGRGIVALRNFRKKEVVGIYDGHRCDDRGMVLVCAAVMFNVDIQVSSGFTGTV